MNYDELTKEESIELIKKQAQEIQYLKFELAQIKRALFGKKSERFESVELPGQLNLFTHEIEEEPIQTHTTITVAAHKKKKRIPKRKKLPENLERDIQTIEPEIDTEGMRLIGTEVTEKLEVVPAKLYVRQINRPKYIDQKDKIHVAPMPSEPFPKSIASASLAAKIVVDKYVDHLPLYRQSKIYKRYDIDLARSTLNNIVAQSYHLTKPLVNKKLDLILKSNYMQADESSLRILCKYNDKGSIKGCMLVMAAPQKKLVCMRYIKTKEKKNIYNVLKNFRGHLQVDGNITYEELGHIEGVTLIYCMAHGRRNFEKALDYDKQKAGEAMNYIQRLYAIEREIKEFSDQEKYEQRQQKAVPILAEFKNWLDKNLHLDQPSDPIQKAIRYMLKRWDGFTEYCNHGHLRIDNNLIERQIRALALGRKNYLFAGAHIGAMYAALFYSLFATCRLNDIEPFKWLKHVMQKIPDHRINEIEKLLPTRNFQFIN